MEWAFILFFKMATIFQHGKEGKEFLFSHSQCTIFKYQFSTLQHNYVATFKALVGKINQVLDIEASNLAIKQPIKPLITFKVVNII
jgi:hypothetical protein